MDTGARLKWSSRILLVSAWLLYWLAQALPFFRWFPREDLESSYFYSTTSSYVLFMKDGWNHPISVAWKILGIINVLMPLSALYFFRVPPRVMATVFLLAAATAFLLAAGVPFSAGYGLWASSFAMVTLALQLRWLGARQKPLAMSPASSPCTPSPGAVPS